MPAYRKASIRELTKAAYVLEGHTIQGVLHREAEGHWVVGDRPLETWLARNEGRDVTLIMVAMEEDRPMQERVCQTCGRKYQGLECSHCKEVRFRLRGR